ncbi:unnamed protein product [Acanthoscelides obtectus]|uniref:Endonuclease/exonuclease/phosphatase domain-containing protein n=1 Tax=Acanthoscelides obtectus TaxID=200917 RepID=A0A9P0Q716_ACAOB|nr:unnamed protein product [Acanthoscelides obtectus]CAK1631992.1 hypothetical protein AOBTE_LOCUS7286 [Acanthoscelides obtectus]
MFVDSEQKLLFFIMLFVVYICNVYIPPDKPNAEYEQFYDAILSSHVLFDKNLVIRGDFNIDMDWAALDANEACEFFYNKLYNAFDTCAPKYVRATIRKCPPWFNSAIIKLIKRKEKIHRSYRRNNDTKTYQTFRELRSKIKIDSDEAYKIYVRQAENEIQRDSNKFWGFLNSKRKSTNLSSRMIYNVQLWQCENVNIRYANDTIVLVNNTGTVQPFVDGSVDSSVQGAYEAGLLKNCAFKPILYYSSNLKSAKGFRLAVVVFIILLQPSEAFDIYRTPTAGSNSKFDLIKFKYLHCIVTLILNYNNTNQIQQAGCVISVSEESIVISCFQHVFLVEMLKCVKKPLPELAIIVRLLGVRDWNILLDW